MGKLKGRHEDGVVLRVPVYVSELSNVESSLCFRHFGHPPLVVHTVSQTRYRCRTGGLQYSDSACFFAFS